MTDRANEPRRQALPTARGLWALATHPTQAIAHPAWSEARETVLALVTAGPAMIVVLGPAGTGKTTLLRDLATTFRERGRSACLLEFGDSPFEVGPVEIVLVDEADRMSATRLDELRSRGDVAIILAALLAKGERFTHDPDAAVVRLSLLSPDGARAFVLERLAQMGLPSGCLTEAAWTQLIASGAGVPRLLLRSLGLALFLGGDEQAERMSDAHVEEAAEAKGGSTDATVEPGDTGANPTQWSINETTFKEEDTSADTTSDWLSEAHVEEAVEAKGGNTDATVEPSDTGANSTHWSLSEAPPYPWRNRMAATAFAAVYLVAVATLLTWAHRHVNERTASGPGAPKVVQTTPLTDHGLAQETSGPHSVSDAPAAAVIPTPIPVPEITTDNARPDRASSASAASFQQRPATTS